MAEQDVFVSYSRRDSAYVQQLVEFLRRQGIPAWADSAIDYGDHWEDVICRQIDNCAAFVPVMTPAAWESPWVRNEVARARQKNKPILPLLRAGEIFFGLSHLEAEDVTHGQLPTPAFVARLHNFVHAGPGTVYGTTTAVPRRRSRWLWPVVAAVAALLIAGGLVAYLVTRSPATPQGGRPSSTGSSSTGGGGSVVDHLGQPPTVGAFTLAYTSPSAGPHGPTSLGYGIRDATGSVYLFYQDPADTNAPVLVLATSGTVDDPAAAVDQYLATTDPKTLAAGTPGRLSGVVKCGALSQSGGTVIACAWGDPGSVGLVYCYYRAQAECANLVGQIRDAVITRD